MRPNKAYDINEKVKFEIEMDLGEKSELNDETYADGHCIIEVTVDVYRMFGNQCGETGFQEMTHESINEVVYDACLFLTDQDGGECGEVEGYDLNASERSGLADLINDELSKRGYECLVKVSDL